MPDFQNWSFIIRCSLIILFLTTFFSQGSVSSLTVLIFTRTVWYSNTIFVHKVKYKESVGELNIVVSLFGSYGWSFRESHDQQSCDILTTEFYHFWVLDMSQRGPLSFVSVFSCRTYVQIIPCEPFPYIRKNVSFYLLLCSTSSSDEQLLYSFIVWDSLSCTIYVYKMYVIVV